jgi:hypothetical protein
MVRFATALSFVIAAINADASIRIISSWRLKPPTWLT